jgi:hypothetical protein
VRDGLPGSTARRVETHAAKIAGSPMAWKAIIRSAVRRFFFWRTMMRPPRVSSGRLMMTRPSDSAPLASLWMVLWLQIPRRSFNVFLQTAARDGTPRSRRSAAGAAS